MEISPREAEVLAAVGEHQSNAQIAGRLHISVRTVESHVSSLLRKLGVADRRELAVLAARGAEPPATGGRLTGIPDSRTSFVGRSRDLDVALERLAQARLVTLLGPGGVGKTRLAAVVAESAAPSYPGGGAFVDLVPVRAGFLVPTVAGGLGVTERPARSLEDSVVERLGVGRSLLVLDNCEHLVEEVGPFVERVLSECPGTTVLATSRQRLGLSGEHVAPVRPLPLDSDAERLFLDRALAVSPDFTADPSAVTRICARLDGMPLAIELAAARSASLGIEGLLAALDDQLRLLTGGRQADERHRSLRAVIAWSHDLLDQDERALFRRLSVFVGGFDLAAAEATTPGATRGELADLIGRLADQSLLVHDGTGPSRWRLLDMVRAFGLEQLADAGEADAARRRHLEWAAGTAAALEPRISAAWEADFDAVADDLRAALAGTEPVPDVTAHNLGRSLAHLTFARRFFVEARGHYRAAADRAADAVAAGRDLRAAADAAVIVSAGPAAFDLLLDAAERARVEGEDNARAAALAQAVVVNLRNPTGFWGAVTSEQRSELLREATAAGADPTAGALLAAARAWHEPTAPTEPTEPTGPTGPTEPTEPTEPTAPTDPTNPLTLSRAAVNAARQTGEPALIAAALDLLGVAAIRAGRFRESQRILAERMWILGRLVAHEPTDAAEITDGYHMAASVTLAAGDLPAACEAVERARRHDPVGDHPYLSAPRLIRVRALSGRFDEAADAARALWDNWVRDGSPAMTWMSSAFATSALVHGLRGDGRYELWRSRALTVAGCDDPAESPDLMAVMAFVDARIAIHAGDVGGAGVLVERAYAAFPERWWEGYARAAGAELAVVAGLPDAAERLAQLEHLATEHRWTAACLDRARGRLERDPDAIAEALAAWERLDARFERACTLLLLPDREPEGHAELRALGCPPPTRRPPATTA
ncbi:LuxR C-terminal-related transcriptional regulator [Actinopolymorpha sp. B11F2]|uniref:ATP-binding protein n=1 Tax=Actinopolymorpha sp. B11F2 TaxID=3160862 RepID=UPI0032E37641